MSASPSHTSPSTAAARMTTASSDAVAPPATQLTSANVRSMLPARPVRHGRYSPYAENGFSYVGASAAVTRCLTSSSVAPVERHRLLERDRRQRRLQRRHLGQVRLGQPQVALELLPPARRCRRHLR